MSTSVERSTPVPLPDDDGYSRQIPDLKNRMPPPSSSSISPVSVTSLSESEVTVLKQLLKIMAQNTAKESMSSGVNNVIQKLQKPFLPSKKQISPLPRSKCSPNVAPISAVKPRKRKLDVPQAIKPALKKAHTNLPPPTLATCNRRVLGSNLRLPRSFTNCAPKSALKYARMTFPFSDRHNCALVPTALFSYGWFCKDDPKTSKDDQMQLTKPKYNYRRRVWLLVPHRLAPAEIMIRKIYGPFESCVPARNK